MPKIVISYRREDEPAASGRIFDGLKGHVINVAEYGFGAVVLLLASTFGSTSRPRLREPDVMVCVIGSRWLGKRKGNQSRIKDSADYVRLEIETALQKGIPVVPLLLDDTPMPSESDLPDSFALRHALNIDLLQDFDVHASRLTKSLDRIFPSQPESRRAVARPNNGRGRSPQ